ncbi:hypothetical protein BTW00_05585 [Psychrobacter sp. C 20.9]|uniref:GIY-YIG nuclease family protein n=1 Tax=Psychrobacter sp. C 20.9 TaxID=1926477 RepID=UPI000946BD27|nr:GIY-YIG nuclease family protein [Psychrobacter sp. C 20.9]OLF36556.1 hypothetical protein BTW00_05585 [Psychrobacter sp. C 20.9]
MMIEQNEGIERLPEFIDRSLLDEKQTLTQISKLFRVDGYGVTNHIRKMNEQGTPIPREVVSHNGPRGYKHLYLIRDIINSAIDKGLKIEEPLTQIEKASHQELSEQNRKLKKSIENLKQQRRQLLSEVNLLTGNLSDIAPVLNQTKFSLVPKSALIKKSKTYGDACGVYFLVKNNEIVYIGQSINIASRITQHRDKDFDSVSYVACHKDELDILESLYILAYQPALNGSNGNGITGTTRPATPITLNKIVQMFHKGELSK